MKMSLLLGAALMLATPVLAATGPILSSIDHPPLQIGGANVVDASGKIIGAVQRVEVTPEGMPTEVAVTLPNDRILVLQAGTVRYDAASNQIIADAGTTKLAAMKPN